MKRSALASAALALASVLSLALGSGSAFAATPPTTSCPNGHWPATVEGRPTLLKSGSLGGDYIWHDTGGWHVRVTRHADERLTFSGRITSSAPLDADPVRLESNDKVSLSADRRTITFRFENYGAIDGIDFTTTFIALSFSLSMGISRMPISRIWLGASNRHPLENPFAVTRISYRQGGRRQQSPAPAPAATRKYGNSEGHDARAPSERGPADRAGGPTQDR